MSVENVRSGSGVEGETFAASWIAHKKKSGGEDAGVRPPGWMMSPESSSIGVSMGSVSGTRSRSAREKF